MHKIESNILAVSVPLSDQVSQRAVSGVDMHRTLLVLSSPVWIALSWIGSD